LTDTSTVGKGSLRNLGRIYFQRRYTILFYTLLFTMVASPVMTALGMSGVVIESLLAACLLAAVMPVNSGKNRGLLLAIMTMAWLARPVTAWFGHDILSAITLGAWTLIGLFAAAAALRFAMRGAKVDAEHLFAALSAYLLAGIYFGLLYWALEQIRSGMFSGSNFSRSAAIYFSFVTLATLGYGDFVPRTDVARGLAVVEGVGGQLFLAVLVARLVSLHSKPSGD
jgi:voltage-gated potassium channel